MKVVMFLFLVMGEAGRIRRAKLHQLQGERQESVEQRSQITVVSYNMYWWNVKQRNRFDALHATVAAHAGSADLFGFQECDNLGDFGRTLSGFELWAAPQGATMAWRSSAFSKEGQGSHPIGSDKWGPRVMNWVRLRVKATNKMLLFANTHGPVSCAVDAKKWVEGIKANRQSDDNVILTGDFNCPLARLGGLKDYLRTHFGTSDSPHPGHKGLDHIFSDMSGRGETHPGQPSDHPLVKAVLGSGSPLPRPAPTPSGPTPTPSPSGSCETVTSGHCFNEVTWAKTTGIHQHPEWYPGLTASSSFEQFQQKLHDGGHANCPAPCTGGGGGGTSSCTSAGQDPWRTGTKIQCCAGLAEELSNWDGGDNWYYKCK